MRLGWTRCSSTRAGPTPPSRLLASSQPQIWPTAPDRSTPSPSARRRAGVEKFNWMCRNFWKFATMDTLSVVCDM
uniref:Uncharacterized protein n=1 Tax=Zea mays TaxID=4577 RepID=A0A804PZQ8_MAIZE